MSPSLVLLAVVLELGSAIAPIDRATIDHGRVLYLANCSRCHGSTGIGDGPDAGLLVKQPADLRRSGALEAYETKALVDRIREGKVRRLEFRPEATVRLATYDEALYAYLTKIPSVRWRAADAGQEIYLDRCMPCHGRYGHPDAPPPAGVTHAPRNLSDPEFQAGISDRELADRIRHGKRGMPALVPRIDPAAAANLVAYVRLLSPGYELYDRFCVNCHGPHGEGATDALLSTPAPRFAFDARFFRLHGPEDVRVSIWHMLETKTPSMPHFDEALTESEANAIVAFLRSLPPLPKESYGLDPD
jgi:mono/diheme cytochrome c family protein